MSHTSESSTADRRACTPSRSVTRGRCRSLIRKTVYERFRLVTAPARSLPYFVVIGAQKAGTSSLYAYLAKHPSVLPASRKEIHYFDSPAFAEGENWYRAHFPLDSVRKALGIIRGAPVITGEASPYYLTHPATPKRMYQLVPDAKLIVMVRNPVDRALSHYQHQFRKGRESLSFGEAISAEEGRLAGERRRMVDDEYYYSRDYWGFSYLTRGRYAEQLEHWFSVFPPNQFLILDSEDFFRDPSTVYAQALAFLGLPSHELVRYERVNSGGEYSGMEPELRQRLSAYFEAPNRRFYELVGRDFGWE